MFTYDLPVGFALAAIFHFIVRDPLVDHLPRFLRQKLLFLKKDASFPYSWKKWSLLILSLVIGVASHLVWDRATHTDTYTYTQRVGINLLPEDTVVLRQWLQWGCSIIGLILIVRELFCLPSGKENHQKQWSNFWLLVASFAALVWAIRINFFYEGDDLINSGLGALLWGVIIASMYANKIKKLPG